MLELPPVIEVQLATSRPRSLSVSSIMVSVHFFQQGRYYYGDSLPLTDRTGRTWLRDGTAQRHFEEDRRLFPMDYRFGLNQCDPEIAIVVRGGAEFTRARQTAMGSGLVTEEVLQAYQLASNETLRSAEVRVPLAARSAGNLLVKLRVEAA